MSRNHLEKRGFKPNLDKIESMKGHRIAGAIVARRARKEWPCAATDCDFNPIEWDEVYVEVTKPCSYKGPQSVPAAERFHMHCALRKGFIVKAGVEKTNRRAAIAMTRAKHES